MSCAHFCHFGKIYLQQERSPFHYMRRSVRHVSSPIHTLCFLCECVTRSRKVLVTSRVIMIAFARLDAWIVISPFAFLTDRLTSNCISDVYIIVIKFPFFAWHCYAQKPTQCGITWHLCSSIAHACPAWKLPIASPIAIVIQSRVAANVNLGCLTKILNIACPIPCNIVCHLEQLLRYLRASMFSRFNSSQSMCRIFIKECVVLFQAKVIASYLKPMLGESTHGNEMQRRWIQLRPCGQGQ